MLKIPYSTQEHKGETNHIIYTVKRANILSKIAIEFNVTVKELVSLNEIENPDLIYVGETLKIEIK